MTDLYMASCRGVPLRKQIPMEQRNVDEQGRVTDSGFRNITATSEKELRTIARTHFKTIGLTYAGYSDIMKNLSVSMFDTTATVDKLMRQLEVDSYKVVSTTKKIKFLRKLGRPTKEMKAEANACNKAYRAGVIHHD